MKDTGLAYFRSFTHVLSTYHGPDSRLSVIHAWSVTVSQFLGVWRFSAIFLLDSYLTLPTNKQLFSRAVENLGPVSMCSTVPSSPNCFGFPLMAIVRSCCYCCCCFVYVCILFIHHGCSLVPE